MAGCSSRAERGAGSGTAFSKFGISLNLADRSAYCAEISDIYTDAEPVPPGCKPNETDFAGHDGHTSARSLTENSARTEVLFVADPHDSGRAKQGLLFFRRNESIELD